VQRVQQARLRPRDSHKYENEPVKHGFLLPGNPRRDALLYCSIAQYVHRDDLPNYCPASKQFCAIGTEELFHTVTFHYSTRNIERLEAIAGVDHLRKHLVTPDVHIM
jgi:hypothetical protein